MKTFGPKKNIPRFHHEIEEMSFCPIRKSIDDDHLTPFRNGGDGDYGGSDWYYCRDSYHEIYLSLPKMLFSHPRNAGHNIARFIRKVEKKLGLKEFTTAGPTNLSNVSWFFPSRFWKGNDLRKSLFTILLRCGVRYDPKKNNFEQAIKSNKHARDTYYAVDYFLKGFTCLKKNIYLDLYGACWVETFDGTYHSHVANEILKKPNKIK